jgi:hypothetical protein
LTQYFERIVSICMEEFLFKILCEFVWKNSCSKYCVNLYGGILVQSMCEFYKLKQYFEQEFFHANSHNTLNNNSSIQIHTILWTIILNSCSKYVWICMEEFLFKVLCKGQYTISYCQRPPISLKILLNISSLISAQFCNEMCAYEHTNSHILWTRILP